MIQYGGNFRASEKIEENSRGDETHLKAVGSS